jgi:predicted dehydrogenase
MREFRVAIAGLGAAARNIHIPALRKIPEARIVGGYDLLPQRCEFPTFGSIEEMLATKPDIVLIATPPASHLAIAKAALEAGAHVYCEKPLANSVEEGDVIARTAETAGRQVSVNSEFPFMPPHLAAAREIGSERFGRLLFMEVHQSFVVTPKTEAGWRGEDPLRTFKEFGTHAIA